MNSSAGQYKIGDFGEAKAVCNIVGNNTLRGTLGYLSPILQEAQRSGAREAKHNPYKSDVYSLGMTLLSMAIRHGFNERDDVSSEAIMAYVERLQYSDALKQVIGLMLTREESNRPDFLDLKVLIRSLNRNRKNDKLAELLSDIRREFNDSQQTTASLVSHIEELSSFAITRDWNAPKVGECYFRKCELLDSLKCSQDFNQLRATSDNRFDYIPMKRFTPDFEQEPMSTLQIEKEVDNEFQILTEIPEQDGYYEIPESGSTIFVKRQNSIVTISENPTSNLQIMRKLLPDTPENLMIGQIYSIGNPRLCIESISFTEISLKIITIDNATTYNFPSSVGQITIGRAEDNHISVQDPSISRNSIAIIYLNGLWYIKDLNSTNGTWLFCHTISTTHRQSNEMILHTPVEIRSLIQVYRFQIIPSTS